MGDADGDDLVEGSDGVSGTDFTGVFGIVVEVLFRKESVLVTDEAVGLDDRRIELDLDLHVLGDGDERAAHLIDEHFARFAEAVDVGIVAVSFVGEGFHGAVLGVGGAVTEHAEENAALGFFGDEFFQFFRAGGADIEIAIGAEDDAIHAFLDEVLLRLFIGLTNAGAAMRGAAGFHLSDGLSEGVFLISRCRGQGEAAVSSVNDDGNAVFGGQLIREKAQALLHEGELIGLVHGSGDIDEEDKITLPAVHPNIAGFDSDACEAVGGLPGCFSDGCRNGEGCFSALWELVIVGEVIDELLNAHGIGRWSSARVQEAADIGIGGGVYVDGESGQRLLGGLGQGIFGDRCVGLARGFF